MYQVNVKTVALFDVDNNELCLCECQMIIWNKCDLNHKNEWLCVCLFKVVWSETKKFLFEVEPPPHIFIVSRSSTLCYSTLEKS